MYSKSDRNLRISQIHHKKKTFRTICMVLTILTIGAIVVTIGSAATNQLVMLDITYDHTTSTKAFSMFNLPSNMPNLKSPINYAQGTLYQRLQVITKLSTKTVKYQFCMFQDQLIKEKHACTNEGLLAFTNPGTYYASQSMTSLFQYGNIDWGRNLLKQMLVVKDKNGIPIDDRYGWAGLWDGSPNFGLYYPMKVRYTAIIVPSGGGLPDWPSGSNGLTVISPNGGENLVRDTNKIISWSSVGTVGANVKIELLKGGVLNSVITSSTANNGAYSWKISSAQTIGSDYKIRITSTTNPVYIDTSNNNFAISSGTTTSITVVSPNGGENWVKSTTRQTKWSFTGNPGSYVKVELLKGSILNKVLTYSTPIGSNGIGYYNWNIPSIQTLGSDYKIRITSTSNSAYTDISNNNFIISNPYIRVISPNGGESWQRGTTKTITWISQGNPGANVKIELYRAGVLKSVISSYTTNDGSYSWYVPWSLPIGSDYKIKITSTSNSVYNDWSNNYFKIY